MDAINQPLLDVRDLGGWRHARGRSVSFSIKRGESAHVRKSGSENPVVPSILEPLPYPSASPSGHPLPRPRSPDGG
jgi:hypothetical protein